MKILTNNAIKRFISQLNTRAVSSSDGLFKIDSAISFVDWLSSSGTIEKSDALRYRNELFKAKRSISPQRAQFPSFPLKYVGLSLAVLSFLLIGGGLYLRFYKNVATPFAFSSSPVRAGRIINFQGRMTDTLGNPITAPIDVTYKFYTVSTGGSVITDSTRVCTASPDQDGVFNSLIGNDTGGSGATLCNVELPSSIFTENPNVYLGVTIGTEITEMSPRQQIANVGYAINAETLQGLPPGSNVSNVPFINSNGNMLIAASNPGVRSISNSNFTISSALATTIQSASSGDITLDATAGGALRFKVYNGSSVEAMTVLNTGRVGIGTIAPRALLDVNGDATVSGSLIAGGQIKIGDFNAAPTNVGNGSLYYDNSTNKVYFWNGSAWTEPGAVATQYFQRTLGSLAPTNITDDVNIGAVATASAMVHLPGLTNKDAFFNLGTGNVGIGTVSPSTTLDIGGVFDSSLLRISGNSQTVGGLYFDASGSTSNISSGAQKTNAIWTARTVAGGGGGTNSILGLNAGMVRFFTDTGLTNGNTFTPTERMRIDTAGNVGIGATSPGAKLDIVGNLNVSTYATVGASLALGTSSAAAGPGNLDMSGNITVAGAIKPGGVAGTSGYLLTSSAGGVNTWTDPTTITSAGNYWNISNGALFPKNATLDAFIGGTATSSAKFAFLNVNSGTPTASVSAGIVGGTFLTADGYLSTTSRQSLTLGNSASYNSTGNILLNPNGTGNVGIGTTTPTAKLDIGGSASSSGTLSFRGTTDPKINILNGENFGIQTSVGGDAGLTERLTVLNGGNVGIGTTNPAYKLEVTNGNQWAHVALVAQGNGYGLPSAATTVSQGDKILFFNDTGAKTGYGAGPTNELWIQASSDLANKAFSIYNGVGGIAPTELFTMLGNGNVGIGTTTPGAKLDIVGNLNVSTYATVGASLALGTSSAAAGPGHLNMSGDLTISGAIKPGGVVGTSGFLLTSSAGGVNTWTDPTSLAGSSYWQRTLGSLAPTNITDDINTGAVATASALVHLPGLNNKDAFFNLGTGNVGIGTTAPEAKLHVSGGPILLDFNQALQGEYSSGGSYYDLIKIGASNDIWVGNTSRATTVQGGNYVFISASGASRLVAYSTSLYGETDNAWTLGSTTNRFNNGHFGTGGVAIGSSATPPTSGLTVSGNVGIGVAIPTAKLDVVGNFNVSTYATVGASLALGTSSAAAGPGHLDMSGNLTISGAIKPGGVVGTSGYVLTSTAGGVNTWTNPSALPGTSLWQSTLGSIAPLNITDSLNLGATATSSALVHLAGTSGENSWINTGSVGIGTVSPGSLLHIKGNAGSSGPVITLEDVYGPNPKTVYIGPNLNGSNAFSILDGATTRLQIDNTGNVGIGNTSPTAKLDVTGNLNVSTYATVGASLALGTSSAAAGPGHLDMSGNITVAGAIKPGGVVGTSGFLLTSSAGGVNTWTDPNSLGSGFNLWQRTLGSIAPLNITDDINTGAVATASAIVHLPGLTNKDAFFNLGTGNVGIGVAVPTAKLDVRGSLAAGTNGTEFTVAAGGAVTGGVYNSQTLGGASNFTGTVNAVTGYKQGGTATSGNVLRGNGTNFVDATLAGSDITGAALTKVDDTNVTVTLGGTPATALLRASSLTLGWTGQLAVARGGTNGTATPTAGAVSYGTGTAYAFTSAGLSGQALLSGAAGAPTFGTLGLTYGGTNADLSAAATGGIVYKGASALSATGALTGVLKGNGSSAPTALTSTADYVSFWSDANTITGEQYLATSRGGLGAAMTAAGAGEIPYSSSTTAYGHLAAGTSSFVLKSNGAAAPAWVDVNTLISASAQYWQQTLGSLAPTNITDALNLGAIATSSALVHLPGTTNSDGWFNLGTGNIGIGTAAPTAGYKLTVNGKILASSLYDLEDGVPGSHYVNPSGNSILGGDLTVEGNISTVNATMSGLLTVGNGTTNTIRAPFGALNLDYYKVAITDWAHGLTLTQDTGRVGIGTVNPDYALDVVGNIKLSSGLIAGSNGAGSLGQVFVSAGGGVNTWANLSDLTGGANQWVRTGGSLSPVNILDDLNLGAVATGSAIVHLPGRTNQDGWLNLGTGNVGIGTASPTAGYKLHVNGKILASSLYDLEDATKYVNPGGDSLLGGAINMSGNLTLSGTTPSILGFDGATYSTIVLKGSTNTTNVAVCIEGSGSGLACDGKLDAGTVDPPYTINGKKYATYLPSMTGVKEETTGNVMLTTRSQTINGYEYVIDFNAQADGSDLWLFSKTTALRTKLNRMSVLLSPNENARTWYKIDEAKHTLTLYSSRPTTLSYRLTAPRFDDDQWKNITPNGSGGFVITDPDEPSMNNFSVDGNGNLTGHIIASGGVDNGSELLDEMGNIYEKIVTNILTAQKVVSPIIESESIKASKSIETPLVKTNEVQISANSGKLSALVINGLNNAPVVSIDGEGNATFAGTLTAQTVSSQQLTANSLNTNNASVSGTLVAKNIQSETIDNLSSQIASSASSLSTNYQLLSTNINEVQAELASLKSQPLPNPTYYQNLDASYGNLTVNNTANIYKAHIADSLMVGTLYIQPTSILALSDDLYISSLSTIHLFDDAVVIAKNGDMTIRGGVTTSSLAIKNTDGITVASIDASGSAQFNEVIANKFTLLNIATQGAFIADSGIRNEGNEIIPAIKTSTEVAGTGIVPIDTKEIIIYNDNVTDNSLIYLTPTTDNMQGQLSVTKKVSCSANSTDLTDSTNSTCVPYFIVSSTSSIHAPSAFNWLIIN